MKLGRATGLLLAGWFLMLPPIASGRVQSNAPLSKWSYSHFDYFSSEQECEAEIRARQESARIGFTQDEMAEAFGPTLGGWVMQVNRARLRHARCVPEDTPGIEWN